MAVRAQQTSVDLRAGVARSQQPESNRLGRGADMKDILNKRLEQEHSQHSTTQRRRSEANPQEVRNIPLEDFLCAIVAIEE